MAGSDIVDAHPKPNNPATDAKIDQDLNYKGNISLPSAIENVPSFNEVQAAISVVMRLFSPVKTDTCESETSSLNNELAEKMCISTSDSKKAEFTEKKSQSSTTGLVVKANNNDIFNVLHSPGLEILRRAFSLMQLNPHIQKMVMSLSSDKALWEAVMKNKAVQVLKDSFLTDGFKSSKGITKMKPVKPLYLPGCSQTKKSIHDESEITMKLLWFISDFLKDKLVALVGKIYQLVNELLGYPESKFQTSEVLDDMLRSTFMLTLSVLLVVVFSRLQVP